MRTTRPANKVGIPGWLGRWLVLLAAAVMAAGCASVGSPLPPRNQAEVSHLACLEFFRAADRLSLEQGVTDGMYTRVPDHPFLRVSRFFASYTRELRLPVQRRFWLEQLRLFDEEARTFEIRNLDNRARAALQDLSSEPVDRYLRTCGQQLTTALADDPRAMAQLLDRLAVPDDYSMLMRALGVYPLTRWPFLYGIRRWQANTRQTFAAQTAQSTAASNEVTYWPDRVLGERSADAMPGTLTPARANPLSIPIPDPELLKALVRRHAPVIVVDERSRADRPGLPIWQLPADGSSAVQPDVDDLRPVMTVRTGHTRVNGLPLLQLIYTVWFSARPLTGPLDLLGGAIDGLTWRVTLDPLGNAWAYDSIHPCGCYHLFFPGPRARPRAEALESGIEEGLFLVQTVPDVLPGERLRVRLASASHYIQSVQVVPDHGPTAEARKLDLIDENGLRSLQVAENRTRSWYGPDGLVAGTERGERFVFWPMGIQSAGAMRQAGRQATAFVGRRHFDDADLFDRYFEMRRPLSPTQ